MLAFFQNIVKRSLKVSPLALVGLMLTTACGDDVSQIGPGLTTGDTTITLDSITYNLDARAVEYDNFDARSGYLMLGNMDVKEFGKLNCSFVTRFLCATKLNIADSLLKPEKVDSCKIRMLIRRGDITGDSLTPQKLRVYRLNKQLPDGITNAFDPEGYYDPAKPLGVKSFTTSMLGTSDSAFLKSEAIYLDVPVDKELGKEVFTQYKEHPEVFQWPQTFAQYFPGIYVNSFFGNGCVANVQATYFAIYYHYYYDKTTTTDGITTTTKVKSPAVIYPFSTSPEVLSSNNISYRISDYIKNLVANGENVLTTPGGYLINLRFPAQDLIDRYNKGDHNLSMVNNLKFSIPAELIDNDYGIGMTPYLLLVKTSKMKEFFDNNQLPDDKNSFTAAYDVNNKEYTFSSMREYIVDLIQKGNVTDDDVDFTIVPVEVTQETEQSYYGSVSTYVTKCTPYTSKPTMARLFTEKAIIVFSFSSQYIK